MVSNSLASFERHQVLRVGVRIVEYDEDIGFVEVATVGDGIEAELGAKTLGRFLQFWMVINRNELTRQHSTLEHVLDAFRVLGRVSVTCRVFEVHRKVDAFPVRCCCSQ